MDRQVVPDVSPVALSALFVAEKLEEAADRRRVDRDHFGRRSGFLLRLRLVGCRAAVEQSQFRQRVLLIADVETFAIRMR